MYLIQFYRVSLSCLIFISSFQDTKLLSSDLPKAGRSVQERPNTLTRGKSKRQFESRISSRKRLEDGHFVVKAFEKRPGEKSKRTELVQTPSDGSPYICDVDVYSKTFSHNSKLKYQRMHSEERHCIRDKCSNTKFVELHGH